MVVSRNGAGRMGVPPASTGRAYTPATGGGFKGHYAQTDPSKMTHQAQQGREPAMVPYPTLPSAPAVGTLTRQTDSRIDSTAIPRPTAHHLRLSEPGGRRLQPDFQGAPSSANAFVTYVEETDSIPRYLRCSLGLLPQSRSTFETSKIPFSVVVHPFPILNQFECPPPVTDVSPYSPIFSQIPAPYWDDSERADHRPSLLRCSKCHAYVNPYFVFAASGAACNLCSESFTMPDWYSGLLAEHRHFVGNEAEFRRRMNQSYDLKEGLNHLVGWVRPELVKGTIDALTHFHPCVTPQVKRRDHLPLLGTHNMPSSEVPADGASFYRGAGFSVSPESAETASFLDPDSKDTPRAIQALVCLVDVSQPAQMTNFARSALASVRHVLRLWPHTLIDFCVISYASDIHLYQLKNSRQEGSEISAGDINAMVVMGEVDQPFLPISSNALFMRVEVGSGGNGIATVERYIDAILKLELASTRDEFNELDTGNASLSAVSVAMDLLTQRAAARSIAYPLNGGTIALFASHGPTSGLAHQPQETAFAPPPALLETLAVRLATNSISVEAYVATVAAGKNETKVHLNHIGYLAAQTGGRVNFYKNFTTDLSYEKLYFDIYRLFGSPVGFDCALKFRCSVGLEVKAIYCPWSSLKFASGGFGRDSSQFKIPRLHCDLELIFELAYTKEELAGRHGYIQVAYTYTSLEGTRKLRILNKQILLTSILTSVFRHSDVESVSAAYTRRILLGVMAGQMERKNEVTNSLIELLLSYRVHAAVNSPFGQLILPESLKLAPVYLTGLLKSKALRTNTTFEERVFTLLTLLGCALATSNRALYPIVYPLHRSHLQVKNEDLSDMGMPTDIADFIKVPPSIPTLGERISTDGIFLMDAGLTFFLYIGKDVDQTVVTSLLGPGYDMHNTSQLRGVKLPPPKPTDAADSLLVRVWNVLKQLRREKYDTPYQPLIVVLAGSLAESELIWHLTEDRLGSEKGYVDFLCDLHRSVQKELSGDS